MRRKHDWYPTPEFATRELIQRVQLGGNILGECCVGDGAISSVLPESQAPSTVFRNDIDVSRSADFHKDVSLEEGWSEIGNQMQADWVATNPPFNQAALIVPLAFDFVRVGDCHATAVVVP